MKCNEYNINRLHRILKSHMIDVNGRGEFDEETDLLRACETVIRWLD